MFKVTIGSDRYNFSSFEVARAFAQKESWLRNLVAEIHNSRTNVTTSVKVENTNT
jgi:hypothetical protein